MKPNFFALLLICGCLHAQTPGQSAPETESLFSLTPMIGTTIDLAPYGVETIYADFALSASSDKIPFISLWGVVLVSSDAVYFRVPLMLTLRLGQSPLSLLAGGGPGSWNDGTGVKVFPVLYGGMNASLGGWSLTAFVSGVFESGGSNDFVLDFYVGRPIKF